MNTDEIDASFVIQVGRWRFGIVVFPELHFVAHIDRVERFGTLAVGPLELFVDW